MGAGSGMGALGTVCAPHNPLRWSGTTAGGIAITQLEELVQHAAEHEEKERPIALKIHAEGSTREQKFETTKAAIAYLTNHIKDVDIELHSLQKAQLEVKQRLDD